MQTVGERLKEYWLRDGVELRPAATAAELKNFEIKFRVSLPEDLRSYYSTVNGMNGGMDDNCFEFLPLHEVTTLEKWWPDPAASSYFIIVDFLISSHVYAIRLTTDAAGDNPVVASIGPQETARIADSFSEFVEGYLEGKTTILGF